MSTHFANTATLRLTKDPGVISFDFSNSLSEDPPVRIVTTTGVLRGIADAYAQLQRSPTQRVATVGDAPPADTPAAEPSTEPHP